MQFTKLTQVAFVVKSDLTTRVKAEGSSKLRDRIHRKAWTQFDWW